MQEKFHSAAIAGREPASEVSAAPTRADDGVATTFATRKLVRHHHRRKIRLFRAHKKNQATSGTSDDPSDSELEPPVTQSNSPVSYPLEDSLQKALGYESARGNDHEASEQKRGSDDPIETVAAAGGDRRASVQDAATGVDCAAHAHARGDFGEEPATLTVDEALAPLKPWMQRFVRTLLTHGGIVELACRAGNVSRSSAFAWKSRDTIFAQLWNDATAGADDLIEASLYVSAVHGNLQPIYQGGILAGYKRVKDTKAAEILLRARRPEAYAPDQVVRIKGDPKVTVVTPQEVPAIVGQVVAALFAARQSQLQQRERPVLDL